MALNTGRTNLAALLTLAMGLACSGCFGGAKKTVRRFVPPPPVARANSVPSATPFSADMMQIPPEFEPELTEDTTSLAVELPPAMVPKPPPRPAARNIPQPATPTPVVPTPAPSGPQLGELLSPAERRQVETDFLATVRRATELLNRTMRRSLTAGQRDTVERVQVFLQQADQEKNRDLPTALQLARRADLLVQDLSRSLSQ